MSLYGYSWDITDKDKWYIVERLLAGKSRYLGGAAIPHASDHNFNTRSGIQEWNLAWAKWFVAADGDKHRSSSFGRNPNTIITCLGIAHALREEKPRITHMSEGKRGGVKTRASPFPEPTRPPDLMEWNKAQSTSDDEAERANTHHTIYHRCRAGIGGCASPCPHIGVPTWNSIHTALHSDYAHGPPLHLSKHQFKIERDSPIPDSAFIQAYMSLHKKSYGNITDTHDQKKKSLQQREKCHAEWQDSDFVARYVAQQLKYAEAALATAQREEAEARQKVDEAMKIESEGGVE